MGNTEKKPAAEELESILGAARIMIFWKDRERRFVGANQAFLDYYGFSSLDDIIGKTDEDMGWHPEPEDYRNDEIRVLTFGESTVRVPGKCMVRGEERRIVASKRPRYENGRIVGLVGSFEDVTEDYLREKERKRASMEKSDFLIRVSHDMRTPLTAITGLAELGMHQNPDSRDAVYFDKILQSADYMLKLVNNILDYQTLETKRVRPEVRVFMISDVINIVETMIRPAAETRQMRFSVFRDMAADRLVVKQDVHRIEQVLTNVLNNAVKYTALGGSVVWRTEIEEDGDTVWVTHTVTDNGEGISPEFMPHLYESFSQNQRRLSRYESGTGLGLAIAKRALDLMGGTISCESEPGKGTTFRIRIPHERASEQEAAAFRKKRQRGDRFLPEPFSGKHILVADNNRESAEILIRALEVRGASAEYAPDGAVACVKAGTGAFDLVLMGLRMPVMNGFESTVRIRKQFPDLPVIGLQRRERASEIRRAEEAGMRCCFSVNDPKLFDRILEEMNGGGTRE